MTLAASFGFFLIPRYEFARPWWPHSVLFFLPRQELRDPGGLIEFSVDIQALEFFFYDCFRYSCWYSLYCWCSLYCFIFFCYLCFLFFVMLLYVKFVHILFNVFICVDVFLIDLYLLICLLLSLELRHPGGVVEFSAHVPAVHVFVVVLLGYTVPGR